MDEEVEAPLEALEAPEDEAGLGDAASSSGASYTASGSG